MKKIFTLLVFLTLLALASQMHGFDFGDAISGISGGSKVLKGAAGIGLKEELSMGGSIAIEIVARQGGVLKDAEMTKRVATIGKALTLYCNRPELVYTFLVLDNNDINAISAPGGYVFVTKGLVNSCKSDQQLSAVIAHEIAHITQRHALKLISGKQGMKGVLELGSNFSGGFGGFDDAIGSVASSLIDKGLPKGDEYDADKVGTLLSYNAGFPPRTLRDFLETLKSKEREKTFSRHPKVEDRIDRLDDQLKEME